MGSCHEIVSHRFVPKRARERRIGKIEHSRRVGGSATANLSESSCNARRMERAYEMSHSAHVPLSYIFMHVCMYAHRSLWGTLSPSLPSSQLSPPSLRPRCDTKQQFKFPSSVEIVRHVTSRINTLKGRHIN